MIPKYYAAALLGVALILLAAVVVPASAVGQCGEANCGKVWTAECLSTQRCVDQGWKGYNCVDDSSCSSGVQTKNFEPTATPAKTPTPKTETSSSSVGKCGAKSCGKIIKTDCQSYQRCTSKLGGYYCVDDSSCSSGVQTKTPTPSPSTSTSSGSSCSSAGGVCRYYTIFYCYSGESNVGRKDCGYLQTCCTPGAPIIPAKGGGKCNNNGVCETGAGGESYLNCPADCPKPMSYSNNKAQPNKTCEDGTPLNACSGTKPKFCSATGRLIDNPSKCGAATTTKTPKVTDTCKAAGGTCKFEHRPSDERLGQKDCGWFRGCYKPNAAAEQARIAQLMAVCGKKGCGGSLKQDCLQTQKCVEGLGVGITTGGKINYLTGRPDVGKMGITDEDPKCVYDKECAELNAAN